MSAPTIDFQTIFPDEVVTDAKVRDIELPGGAGVMALVTLDNGKDHTRPNTFGPQTLMRLAEVLDGVKARVAGGELAAVAITVHPRGRGRSVRGGEGLQRRAGRGHR